MTQRFIRAPTLSPSTLSLIPRPRHLAYFNTSSSQWFRRFLSPKEEKQLYMGITALFREKLKEKSTPSNLSYSNIIDQVILGAHSTTTLTTMSSDSSPSSPSSSTPLTLNQLQELKQNLDTAGKAKDLVQLEALWHQLQQAGQQVPTTMYNRLIRGFLSCPTPQGLAMAKQVVDTMMETQQHRLPTTRTCTYMIQAYLKRQLPLDEARPYVAMLQHYSLNKLRTPFDYSVMLRYYIQCGNAHAIDFLWKDLMRHSDTIQPGSGLYTRYAEWLLSSHASLDLVTEAARSFVKQFGNGAGDNAISTSSDGGGGGFVWTDYQISVWLKIVLRLAHADNSTSCVDADQLMLAVVTVSNTLSPPTTSMKQEHSDTVADGTASLATTTTTTISTKKQGMQAIQDIIYTYLAQAQDLKVLAFYYRLRKFGIKEDAFSNELTMAIDKVMSRVEIQQHKGLGSKTLAEEFGALTATQS